MVIKNIVSGPLLRKMLKWPRPLPLEDERVRLIHEVLILELVCEKFVQVFSACFSSPCISS